MAALYLALGLLAIARPEILRKIGDKIADFWKKDSWHPLKMPPAVLRWLVGTVGIAGAVFFFYLAYLGSTR
jgi:hypothetical protein